MLDLLWAKYILFGAAGPNRPNSGNRIAIDQSLLQRNLKRPLQDLDRLVHGPWDRPPESHRSLNSRIVSVDNTSNGACA
jgi:hypothetical protein